MSAATAQMLQLSHDGTSEQNRYAPAENYVLPKAGLVVVWLKLTFDFWLKPK